MEEQTRKFNPYIVIIVILLIAVAILTYKQWSGKSTDIEVFKDDIQIGRDDAPVTIIEYYSYLCGYCKQFEDSVKPKIVENYITTGKVKLILRSFPPYELSQAILCANDQEKFLEYHNYLFANNDKIESIDNLKSFAKAVGLNESEFSQCLDSGKYKSKAEEWYAQGSDDFIKANIPKDRQGTPAFFINGEPAIGSMPYEDFAKIIESKLK
ncbi:MAG TPA: thioredoxin domain-containing protein [Candidatus Paceibacterota bacterium]|nr:thioredoxin domain-containing protein [Candidatus Paceibacterota bacterium]